MAETDRELQLLENRFRDLAERSFMQGIFTFTGFLSLAQQEVLYRAADRAGCRAVLFGGTEYAERQMARFGDVSDLGYEEPFPIVCLCIEPRMEKFSETFTHRDFLGAVLNTGIDRSAVGDIFLGQKRAWLFCTEKIAPWLEENLTRVRHTPVRCRRIEDIGQLPGPTFLYREENVASLRCDGVVAAVWNLSRSKSLELFRQKKVYVNGRQTENNSCLLKEGDRVSVRGYGKFLFRGEKHLSRKGKPVVGIDLFA